MRESSESALRLFVACELPSEMKERLAQLQDTLRAQGAPSVRWVRPEGIHLTLKFLGEVPREKVPAVRGALAPIVEGIPPLSLSLGEVGTFGGRRGVRVLWVDIEGNLKYLTRLQERVESALEPQGFPPEGRPFSPHLTLARVPDSVSSGERRRLKELADSVRVPSAPPVTIREVSLMRSILGPGAAVYERVAAFPLS
jgi:2'-5' RNA ligase